MPTSDAAFLRSHQQILAEKVIDLQYERQPEIWRPYGDAGREKGVRDARYHLTYLAEAVEVNDWFLFGEYLAWVKVLYANLNLPEAALPVTLESTRQVLVETLPLDERDKVLAIWDAGVQKMLDAPLDIPSFVTGDGPLDELARRFLAALLTADRRTASQMILDAVDSGVSIPHIYTQVFQRTQQEIGRLWQLNKLTVAQEHFCTAATQMVMSQLYPYIFTGERKDRRIIVACVGGELHEIGARMVADLFEMNGWDSYFLGANTPSDSIFRMVEEQQVDILALSTTMTFHVSHVTDLIRDLHARTSSPVRVLVGGYPFNLSPELWRRLGADGYAPDAEGAIVEAERVLAA